MPQISIIFYRFPQNKCHPISHSTKHNWGPNWFKSILANKC